MSDAVAPALDGKLTAHLPEELMDLAQAARELFESPSREFTVRLWDGATLHPARDGGPEGQVVLRSRRALDALLPPVSERRLADAVLDGDIDFEGDTIGLLTSAARWEGPRLRVPLALAIASALLRRAFDRTAAGEFARPLLSRLHSLTRDRRAVRHHYDLSDEFYRLFLDPAMVYSSGYFARGGESLEQAQQAKLELVCRKLALARGERLLDVGCGWGAFLRHAVGQFQVDAVGITLSRNQLAEAKRRLARAGAGPRAAVVAADYRTLPAGEKFHKIASIGMMEHVGRERLGRISVYQLLLAKPSQAGQAEGVPRCRAEWYRGTPVHSRPARSGTHGRRGGQPHRSPHARRARP